MENVFLVKYSTHSRVSDLPLWFIGRLSWYMKVAALTRFGSPRLAKVSLLSSFPI